MMQPKGAAPFARFTSLTGTSVSATAVLPCIPILQASIELREEISQLSTVPFLS